MRFMAYDKKENAVVWEMGYTDTIEAMQQRLKDSKAANHILIVESQNHDTKAIYRDFDGDGDRYQFDFDMCKGPDWQQYDTDQDAWYFGVWVNLKERKIVTYCEGDIDIVFLLTDTAMQQELIEMANFYGDPPPAFVVFDYLKGTVTNIYDERPTMEK